MRSATLAQETPSASISILGVVIDNLSGSGVRRASAVIEENGWRYARVSV